MSRFVFLTAVSLLCTAAADGPKVTVAGGRSYVFPPAAFEDGQAETGKVGSLLFDLAWPEMRPLTPNETAAWPRRDTIRVLTVTGAPVDGGAVSNDALLADMPNKLAIAENMGVREVEASHGHPPPPRIDPAPVPAGNPIPGGGMRRIRTEPSDRGGIRDVFAQQPLAQPRIFITCDRADKLVVDPECAQVFVAADMSIKVSYRRALVPQWGRIETKTIAFLRDHEVRP